MANTEIKQAIGRLRKTDPVLLHIIDHVGEFRLRRSRNYFLTLVEAIVWQQLSWKAANTIHGRMLDRLGTRRPAPSDFLKMSKHSLRNAGLSRAKVEYLLDLAAYFEDGRFPRRQISRFSDDEVIASLTTVKGIGRWTAQMFLIFAMGRLDVFPDGDLSLVNSIQRCYKLRRSPSRRTLDRITDPWKPYRTIGSWYLWSSTDAVPL